MDPNAKVGVQLISKLTKWNCALRSFSQATKSARYTGCQTQPTSAAKASPHQLILPLQHPIGKLNQGALFKRISSAYHCYFFCTRLCNILYLFPSWALTCCLTYSKSFCVTVACCSVPYRGSCCCWSLCPGFSCTHGRAEGQEAYHQI